MPVSEVAKRDMSYLVWILRNRKGFGDDPDLLAAVERETSAAAGRNSR
jgi:hypothetical protein